MRYVSTRAAAPACDFDGALLSGLAPDGGLYVPADWPRLAPADIAGLRGLAYPETAGRLIAAYLRDSIAAPELAALIEDSYRGFDDPAVAPLKELSDGVWLLELFHGPTLAFKDVALQLVGRLLDRALARRGGRVVIIGATSGDTGSAAIEACRDRQTMDVFILHPEGRVSEVQRRQMTTVAADNVHNIAIAGTFDDCQALIKALFADAGLRDELRLTTVNSINWARIVAQIVYYFHAAVALGAPEREIVFAVPSGNFGNAYAGYAARAMGLGIERVIVGSNRNDVLPRFFESGELRLAVAVPTLSPSMDIQLPSNFERLLYELCARDGAEVGAIMERFRRDGTLAVDAARLAAARAAFAGHRLDDGETMTAMAEIYRETGELVDPHSAIAVAAARAARSGTSAPIVALATAHPAKFPDAVAAATGVRPALPPRLGDLFERPEHLSALPNDLAAVRALICERVRRRGAV